MLYLYVLFLGSRQWKILWRENLVDCDAGPLKVHVIISPIQVSINLAAKHFAC